MAALLAVHAPAHAADRYWDPNGTTPGYGGTGTWNLTSSFWSPSEDGVSGPYTAWSNSALDNAIFGSTAGTVTLGGPITAHNLTFDAGSTGYVLSGGTLTLGGTAPTITTNSSTATINSVIAGSSGLTKAGAGTLVLNGINTFTGDINLNAGSLNAGSDAALGAASNNIFTGAGASVTVSIAGANTNRAITIGDGGTLSLAGSAGSALITGNGQVSVGRSVTMSNDSSTYTGRTTFHGVNGIATSWFTSIGNLGEASSLGAPTTVSDGTVVFNQSSQYSDNVIYIGTGNSSNRNWDLNGAAANIHNQGTGTLSITGDVDTSGGSGFYADDADIELLGILSGGNYGFSGSAGRTITLGGANTYTGTTGISTITVSASTLADIGTASSFGAGSGAISIANNGILSYTGAGGSSNRTWTIGSGSILNDGGGDLTLSGAVDLGTAASDSLTLGGSFAGINTLSGVISGTGNLIGDGAGTWVLSGANTRTGAIVVDGGTLRAGNASAFGTITDLAVNGGTLDLGGFDLVTPTLEGTGGAIALGANSLTVDTTKTTSYAGSIAGSGGLSKAGVGTLTLSGANTYTGDTTLGGGGLTLDYSAPGAPTTNVIAAASTLNMAGGKLDIIGAGGTANSQSFNGLNITAGSNEIAASSGAGGTMTVNFGAITRTGGLVDFALPASGNFMTSSTSLGGWATVNGTDYAKVDAGVITAFTPADYANKDDASTWLTGDVVSDVGGAADTPFFNTVTGSQQLGGLKYTAAAASTVNIGAGETLGIDGTIIVASSVGAHNQTISGGSLTGGAGGGTLGILQNGAGNFTIASTIVDNGPGTGFTKGGSGLVTLTGANSYTGPTTLSGGTLSFNTIANGGLASGIGASTADASNLVLESGTLSYTGTTAATDRGFTLANGGPSRTIAVTGAGANLTFSGLVTSADDAGFNKTGAGTLTLANADNDYDGVTTVNGGTLAVSTLANGGEASSIGESSSDAANLVLAGGTLDYLGATASSDRSFTLGAGSGGIGVSDPGATLTMSGTATGTGGLHKEGAGTLVLTGINTYTGGTTVNDGTLRAGSAQAFGSQTATMTVNAGATLDLGGFGIKVGALRDGTLGGGSVSLGAATLTIGGTNGTFSGVISGAGGLTQVGAGTQVMSGCNNTYSGVTTLSGNLTVDCLADGGEASGIGASGPDSANLVFTGGRLTYTGTSIGIDRGFTMQSGDGYINVNDADTVLEFEGAVVGGGRLRKEGAGTLLLSGTNTYTGGTIISAGVLRAGSNDALGSGAISFTNTAGATLDLDGFDNTVGYLSGGGALGGNVTLGAATLTLNWPSGSGSYAGAISGSGGLIKNGGIAQSLTGCASDYTGGTAINGGVLAVSCLTDGGVASSMGASTADASNLIINGGTLRYVGVGDSTDRQFTLGASGGNALDASGTGAINFTSNAPLTFSGANTVQTLTLTGTSIDENTLAAEITNNGTGVTSLTKTGTGTWILTNPDSNYTGKTVISGGVLGVDKLADGGLASSLGASSAGAANLVIGNNSTLRYTGTGDTTNRLFTLSAGTTTIQSSGTGAIVFTDTGPVTLASNNQNRTIALGGTNADDNTLAGSIGDAGTGTTILAKNDGGTWVLTGNNTYTGYTVINDGTLKVGGGGTTGSIVSDTIDLGTLVFDRSNEYIYDGVISNVGNVEQAGSGTTILTGDSDYTGGTTISAGTLQLGNGGASGSILGDVADDGVLAFDRSDSYTFGGTVSGTGALAQIGTGTTILTADNGYTGGTTITDGTLQLGNGGTTGSIPGDVTDNGALAFDRSDDLSFGGTVSGTGSLTQLGAGILTLTADNSYAGGTTISAGTLQVGDGGATGSITGDVTDNSALVFDRSGTLALDGVISGTGTVTKAGPGTTILAGTNTYAGATDVAAGTLLVNGDQSGAAGLTSVASGATLGGAGKIGGSVTVADGGAINPGGASATPGTLAITGDLALGATSTLNYDFGQANMVGGPLNDLVTVGGNLTLGGTLNVTQSPGGSFGPGVYRIISYNGTLTDNGLAIGSMPPGSDTVIQTAVANQVNLVNTAGLAFSYWDGDAGPKNDGTVNGNDGTWRVGGGNNNWTEVSGTVNADYAQGSFAIFEGTPGTVTVDNAGGQVQALGMQFVSSGYLIQGSPIELVPDTNSQSIIRVGDGTAAGAGYTATIASVLTGTSELVKTDLGTLVLTGANTYTGGAAINGGTLAIASDTNLGDAAGGLSFDGGTLETTADIANGRDVTLAGAGTFLTDAGTQLTLTGPISGAGSLTKDGTGTLVVTGDAAQTGGTTIAAGTLQLGNGGTTGTLVGDVIDNGTLAFDLSNSQTFGGVISGTGDLQQIGPDATILTGDSSYSGGTTIAAGALELGNGGTSGSITGDVINNGTLTFHRSDAMTFAGTISGTGGVRQIGTGTTTLTGSNTYGGTTTVQAGTLLIDGNQAGASGLTSVASAATLGGTGTIGGDVTVADGGAISPGEAGNVPGTLTVNGGLALGAASSLNYDFGQAGVVGGAFNDLTTVGGNLALGGTINVATSAGASLDPGVYRVISYNGALTNPSGLALGTLPTGTTFFVQTSVAQQVNLVNTTGLTLRFWDGATGPKNNGVVNGGDGIWQGQNPLANDNWTEVTGTANAPWTDTAFAVFEGVPGTVTVDATTQGPVRASGMQFATDGYTLQGEPIALVADGNGQSVIRVGDGTSAGTGYTATIASVLTGTSELLKTDLGTLVLTGTNTYTGGTTINGGTLAIASDTNLGDAAGGLSFDGGTLETIADVTSGRAVTLAGAGTFLTDAGTTATLSGGIAGAGTLIKDGAGTLVVTGDAVQTGGTTIVAGTLQLGDGGTSGSIDGDVVDNAALVFSRSDTLALDREISGSGSVSQNGSGITVLTGANTYTGPTVVSAGSLYVNGDQSGATGLVSVLGGGTLGGKGTVGGDVAVANGGTLSPGDTGQTPGTLTINGNLSLDSGSTLNYRFGQPNVAGGTLNDLTVVHGDLVLDGTLDVTTTPGGNFGAGIYRVFNYDGALTDNGLSLGSMPSGSYQVQTSVDHQVNLINAADLLLNFWDGEGGTANDSHIQGGDGTWRLADNTYWTEDTGAINAAYSNGAYAVFMGVPGKVAVDNANGQVQSQGMQFAVDGYTVDGDALELTGGSATIRVGDGTAAGADMKATIDAVLAGHAGLVKTDLGTLVLNGVNTYTGGTTIEGGILQVASDANLGDAAGHLALDSATLHTTDSFSSQRDVDLTGNGTILTDGGSTLTLVGSTSGAGGFTKAGAGTLVLAGSASHDGDTIVAEGTLRAGAAGVFSASSAHAVQAGATLDLAGYSQSVASLTNAGTVSLAGGPGTTLTVHGNYVGNDGTLLFNTALGGDGSATDRITVAGDTSGHTSMRVTNVGGAGAQTTEGIKLIDVGGASNGTFSLAGDYVFQGDQAVVSGAYAYRLYKNGTSTPDDGDWYLRSALTQSDSNPGSGAGGGDPVPLYQPGVPLYEAYAGVLRAFNTIGTLYQRVGSRTWANAAGADGLTGQGVWVRTEGADSRFRPTTTTSGTSYGVSAWKMEVGDDMTLADTAGGKLVGGVSLNYGRLTSDVSSIYGRGRIQSDGYGVAATLTWYGEKGFYVDGQARVGWYDSDLRSQTLGKDMAGNNGSRGSTVGVEVGRQIALNDAWSLTPQAQLSYSRSTFDSFTDPFGAPVSIAPDKAGVARAGMTLDYRSTWSAAGGDASTHLYGIANFYQGIKGTTMAMVADTALESRNERQWGGLGVGGTVDWGGGRYSIYGEVQETSSLSHFRDSHSLNGTLGFRMRW